MTEDEQNTGTSPDEQTGTADSAAADTPSSAAGKTPAKRPRKRRPNFFRRHLILTSLGVIVILLVSLAGGFAWWANQQLASIPRVEAGIEVQPGKDHNEGGKPLNILMLGLDNGNSGESVADDLADGEWTPGLHRSDTIMVLHVPADRDSAQLVSIPRDTWVKIDGYPSSDGYAKINAAFSYGGPALAVTTVQDVTNLTFDHVAMIDWDGFRDLSTAVDGVRIYIPQTFTSNRVVWEEGWQTIEGERALQYVRTRYDLPGDKESDFGRIARQQNFLRALMGQLMSPSTTRNPLRFTKVLSTVTGFLTVDKTWDTDEMRNLALSLRNLRPPDVQFITAPFESYGTSSDGQSYVRLAPASTRELFRAVADGDLKNYIAEHPEDRLASPTRVN